MRKSHRRDMMSQIWNEIGFTCEPPYQHLPNYAVNRIKGLIGEEKYLTAKHSGKAVTPYFDNRNLGLLLDMIISANQKSFTKAPSQRGSEKRSMNPSSLSSRLKIIKALHEIQGELISGKDLGTVESKLWGLLELF